MASIVVRNFGGMLPRYGVQHIPESSAALAVNCRLDASELQAYKQPSFLYSLSDLGFTPTRVFAALLHDIETPVPFADSTVDFVKAPLVADSYNRHYWTSAIDYPRYATEDMLLDGDPGWILGVAAPDVPPTVVPTATGGALELTRVYVYTFVTTYGEEGAPSPPTTATGDDDANWNISGFQTVVNNSSQLSVEKIFIYRTITGTLGAVDYFKVGEIPLGQTTFTDTMDAAEASLQPLLISVGWNEPPFGLRGLCAHPNGFLVGFKGRDIYFSVPYRPHAWPVDFILSVRYDIVGIAITGQSVGIMTKSSPFIASGVRPEGMSLLEANTPDACVSSRGIVAGHWGVLYPGQDGLMLLRGADIINVTTPFLSRREWQLQYSPESIQAAEYNGQYVAFYDTDKGFVINPDEQTQLFVTMQGDIWRHSAMQGDALTGNVWMVKDDAVWRWNPVAGKSVDYIWRSKVFDTPAPVNFGAYRIVFGPDFLSDGAENAAELQAFNDERIQYPLNPINFAAINKVRVVPLTSTLPQNSQPFHRSPLYQNGSNTDFDVHLRVWADGELVYDYDVPDTDPNTLPTGFRRNLWQFELSGTANVQSLKVAETGKELASV